MMIPFPILVLASQLMTVASEDVPVFDIARGCKEEGNTVESREMHARRRKGPRSTSNGMVSIRIHGQINLYPGNEH
jgi:hypothetical protein